MVLVVLRVSFWWISVLSFSVLYFSCLRLRHGENIGWRVKLMKGAERMSVKLGNKIKLEPFATVVVSFVDIVYS